MDFRNKYKDKIKQIIATVSTSGEPIKFSITPLLNGCNIANVKMKEIVKKR